MDYDKLARDIYAITGPAENIQKAYNCMTRLRLSVTDEHFTKEDLEKLPGVMGVNRSGDEWQIIVGPGKATKLYQAFETVMADSKRAESSPQDDDGKTPQSPLRTGPARRNPPQKCDAGQAGLEENRSYLRPHHPCLYRLRLITGLLNIAVKVDPTLAAQPVFQMLAIAGNAAFFGLNIFVGINAAKEFGGSPMLGASWPPS